MSTVIALKHGDTVILAADSRFMRADFSGVASDTEQKIFPIGRDTFIATAGWKVASDLQIAKAGELAGGAADIRVLAEGLERETLPELDRLVNVLRTIRHMHEKIRRALDGELIMHATVLVGRAASGELGYINQVYRVRDGRVVCESGEHFGGDWRMYTTSGDPARQVAEECPSILGGAPLEVVQKLLAALKAACPTIGGKNQIVSIDGGGARWISEPPTGPGAACRGLEIATALFAGDTIFARTAGGKVTINSAGVAIADNLTTPTATVTATATGVTVAKGTNNVQVDANGVAVNGPSGANVTVNATGITVAKGTSSVTVSATAVTIVNGALSSPTITGGSLAISGSSGGTNYTINIDPTNLIRIQSSTGTTRRSLVSYAYHRIENPLDTLEYSQIAGFDFSAQRNIGGSYRQVSLGPTSFVMDGLPSGNPGAGSKQFWYDPSDANRVKFAA